MASLINLQAAYNQSTRDRVKQERKRTHTQNNKVSQTEQQTSSLYVTTPN
jgi:hypothetical protein